MPFRRSLLRLSCGLLLAVSARAATLVGTLGGSVSVDNHGAANYSVPLVLPAGRAGLEPKLSINYNSGGGNGTLGVGFSLSTGFPQAITRGRSILARDGVVRGVNFDANDKYYLDGKRLICVSGTEGSPGSTYRTEVDSFVTISTTGTGTNIDTFTVADKSGLTFVFGKYGSTADAYQMGALSGATETKAYTYALKRVTDTLKNTIEFTYAEVLGSGSARTGEYVLSQIVYTGNDTLSQTGRARVTLSYNTLSVGGQTARKDAAIRYVATRAFGMTRRLDSIKLEADLGGGYAQVGRYDLGYEYAPNNGRTRLISVKPYLRTEATTTLDEGPATTFDWTDGTTTGAAASRYSLPTGSTTTPTASGEPAFAFGDFNGDGKDDYVDMRYGLQVYLSTGTGFTAPGSNYWMAPASMPANFYQPSGLYGMRGIVADINGDGLKDLILIDYQTKNIYAVLSTGSSFTGLAGGSTPTLIASTDAMLVDPGLSSYTLRSIEGGGASARITVGDYTGDGRDDVLVHGYDGYLYLLKSQGSSFAAAQKSTAHAAMATVEYLYDWHRALQGTSIHNFSVSPMPCDLNGDGLLDYVWSESTSGASPADNFYVSHREYWYALSKGDGSFAAPVTFAGGGYGGQISADSPIDQDNLLNYCLQGDFNGDGLPDFLILQRKATQLNEDLRWMLLTNQGTMASGDQVQFSQSTTVVIPATVSTSSGTRSTIYHPITADKWTFLGCSLGLAQMLKGQLGSSSPAIYMLVNSGATANTFALDVNHDGYTDFVWWSSGWWVLYSNGSGFGNPTQLTGAPWVYAAPMQIDGASLVLENVSMGQGADINGDGLPDFILNESWSSADGNVLTGISFKSGPFEDVLASVTNGLGEKTSLTFKGAKDDALYTPGVPVSYPIRELRASSPVVSDLYRDPGSAANASAVPAADRAHFSYQYSGRRLDLSGRGDLGFHSFVTLDEQTKVFKYQFLTQSFPMTGLVSREQTYRYWENATATPTYVRFRLLSSHDNTVVFDGVVNASGAAYGTVYPFISKAVESRWEDSNSYQFTWAKADATGPAETRSESLFPQTLPTGAHIQITATSNFDNQGNKPSDVQTTVPGTYDPSDADPTSHANSVTGYASYASYAALPLPLKITYGNLTQLTTDYGDGFTETVTNTYYAATAGTNLTGRINTVTTTVTSPGYGSQPAPAKTYTYKTGTPLVTSETLDASEDRLDLVTTYTRDTLGRVTATSLKSTSLNSGDTYGVSSVIDFDDRFDLPAAVQDNYAHQTSTTYDAIFGKPVSVTDVPNNATVTNQYDALGRLTQTVDQLKSLQTDTTIAWTTSSATDWKKTQTVSGPSDADGVPTGSTIVGVKAVTLTSAYAVRTVTTVQPPVTTYYDRLGRAIRTIKEGFAGQKTCTDTAYNNLGQVVATSVPYLSTGTAYWTKTDYDPLGRVSTVTAPNGTVTTTTYKGRATVVSVKATDRTAQVNSTVVDAKGATVKVWNADNVPTFTDTLGTTTTAASVAFTLDGFGRMRVTTLNGQTQTITADYDDFGRQTSLNDPDKGAWTYVNDALGRITKQTDAVGNVTATSYDRLNRPLTRTTSKAAGPVETATWSYYDWMNDSAKHLVAVGDQGWFLAPAREESVTTGAPGYGAPKTTTVHYYDPKGRPAIDLATIDGKYFYTYTSYDAYSRVDHVRHYWRPAGKEAPSAAPYVWQDFGYHYTYDAESYLLSVTDTATPNRTWWEADATTGYDYLDRPVKVKKAGAYTTNRTYDPEDGTLTAIQTGRSTATDVQNLSFTYDGLGNLKTRSDALRTGTSESLTYDTLNRLVTSKQGTTGYLANGNLSSKVSVTGAASGTYAYDATHPHAVKTAFGYTMGYDANGNLLTRTKTGEAWDLEWTGFDKPRWMAKATTVGSTTTTVGSEFSYNANRSRVLQLEFDAMSGGAPSHYVRKRIYALGSTLEINYANSAAGATADWSLADVRIYVPGPDGVIGAREFTPGVSASLAEKTLVYHYDHLGSIQVVTQLDTPSATPAADDAGKPAVFSEDAWGQRRDPLDWAGAPVTTDDGGADSVTPRGFTGHEMLDDLGLVHMNGRIYDPLLGRMLSADLSIQYPDSLQSYNRYSYVRNNPLTLIDPTGWWEFKIAGLRFANDGNNLGARATASLKQAFSATKDFVKSGSMDNLKGNLKNYGATLKHDLDTGGPMLVLIKDFGMAPAPAPGGPLTPLLETVGFDGAAVASADAVTVNANAISGTLALADKIAGGDIKPTDGATVSEKPPLKEGDTGTYGELKSRSKTGDGLDVHESPSNKAQEKAFVENYRKEHGGADPSPQEIAANRQQNASVAIRRDTHVETDTFGGKNTDAKSAADAADLDAAAQRGADSLKDAGEKTGVDLSKAAEELLELQKKRNGG